MIHIFLRNEFVFNEPLTAIDGLFSSILQEWYEKNENVKEL